MTRKAQIQHLRETFFLRISKECLHALISIVHEELKEGNHAQSCNSLNHPCRIYVFCFCILSTLQENVEAGGIDSKEIEFIINFKSLGISGSSSPLHYYFSFEC